jgi:hypothetical protein
MESFLIDGAGETEAEDIPLEEEGGNIVSWSSFLFVVRERLHELFAAVEAFVLFANQMTQEAPRKQGYPLIKNTTYRNRRN